MRRLHILNLMRSNFVMRAARTTTTTTTGHGLWGLLAHE
jgi:hypothetical protein